VEILSTEWGQWNEEEGWDGWWKPRGLATGIWGKTLLASKECCSLVAFQWWEKSCLMLEVRWLL